MRSLFLTTAAFAALMLGAPIGTAHAAAVDHRQAAKQACYADGRAHFHAGKLTRSALVDWNDRCDAVASEVDAGAGDDAHATQVTAYPATHDIACMTERANLSTKYPHTKAWGAAMANLTAFGGAHATEIRQGFEPRETCADAGDYAIALTLHGDAIPADKTPGGLPMCSAAFVDAYEANGSKAVMPAESCFMDTAVSGAKVCDSEKCVDTDEAGDDNAIGSFFATFRPHEEIAMGHGVTCTNPYAFDIYLDAPKGKGKSKVYPVRDVYHVNLPALRCS